MSTRDFIKAIDLAMFIYEEKDFDVRCADLPDEEKNRIRKRYFDLYQATLEAIAVIYLWMLTKNEEKTND